MLCYFLGLLKLRYTVSCGVVDKLFSVTEYTGSTSKQAGPLPSLAFGAIAGLLGQSSSYPLDIVRRRMQTSPISGTQYKTIFGTLKKIYRYNEMYCYLEKG